MRPKLLSNTKIIFQGHIGAPSMGLEETNHKINKDWKMKYFHVVIVIP